MVALHHSRARQWYKTAADSHDATFGLFDTSLDSRPKDYLSRRSIFGEKRSNTSTSYLETKSKWPKLYSLLGNRFESRIHITDHGGRNPRCLTASPPQCPEGVKNGSPARASECPLSGVKQTKSGAKRTSALESLLLGVERSYRRRGPDFG